MKRTAAAFFLILVLSAPVFAEGAKLSLRECIDIARANSESIAIAKARLDGAEALAGQAFSAFLPTIKVDASYGRGYQSTPPITVGPPFVSSEVSFQPIAHELDTLAYSVGVSQNLFAGGRVWNSWGVADIGVTIARDEYRSSEIDLAYNVISAYYGAIKAKKGLDLAKESVDMANKHLEQTRTMFDSGIVTKAEILRSELEVAKAELALSRTKNGAEVASNSLNVVIGRGIDEPVVLDEEGFKIGDLTAPDYQEFLAIAYKTRPDWHIMGLSREIADKGNWISYTGYIPAFFLQGSYGYNNVKDTVNNSDSMLNNWNVAVVGSWTIFDGFATPNKVKEAYSKYVEAAKNNDLLKKRIAIDVKNACSSLNSAVEEVRSAAKALELAEENYNIAELRFSAGVGTNLEVMDAKTMLTGAKLDFLQSEFNYELAKASVNRAVGKEVFLGKAEGQKEMLNPEIVLQGTVKYVDIEGGFVGFTDASGNNYDIMGEKAAEIVKEIGSSIEPRKIRLTGKIRKDIATIRMWGTPFEVTSYEWGQQ